MEHRFYVHPLKCTVGLICCVTFVTVGICMLLIQRWGSAIIFFLLALVFGAIALICGALVHINRIGIKHTILGIKTKELSWSDIAEIGVAGSKVFSQHRPEDTGSLYIYFSKTVMTEQERFEMMVKWPPFDKIYLAYTTERIRTIQTFWDSKIETYNVGDLAL